MNTRKTLLIALFAGLIIVGTFIKVPLPPVPITLQTFFVILAALLGGIQIGFTSVCIYLILGIIGLPVFTSGGGLAALIGPTGGYLLAMIPVSLIAGIFSNIGYKSQNKKKLLIYTIIGGLIASLTFYLIGIPWLMISLSLEFEKAIKVGMLPFLIGDSIKLIVAVIITYKFSDRVRDLITKETED